MKRNARPSPSPVNRLLLATVALLALAGSIGVATVWLRHQISEVARANKQIQARTAEVERRINETNAQVAAARNPQTLLEQNRRMGLRLASPVEAQLVRVDADIPSLLAANQAGAIEFRRLTVRIPSLSPEPLVPAAVIVPGTR